MITTTVGALLEADDPLTRLAARPLPLKAAYHLKKLARLVAAELKTFHEMRDGFVKELGTEREPTPEEAAQGAHGPIWYIAPGATPAWQEFQRRVGELVAVPATLPLAPLDASLLGEERISARDLELLDPLLTLQQP